MHGLNGCCREAGCGKQWLFPYSRCPQSRLIQNHPLQSRQERQAIGFAHGQYILPEAFPDELYLWQQRTGKMIYLHETALFLHDISERTPPKLTATVPSTLAGRVKVYYGKPDLFELGAVLRPSKLGHQVRASGADNSRNPPKQEPGGRSAYLCGVETVYFFHAPDFNKLREYAEAFCLTGVLRTWLGVLMG